jgi:hypothetical protein
MFRSLGFILLGLSVPAFAAPRSQSPTTFKVQI